MGPRDVNLTSKAAMISSGNVKTSKTRAASQSATCFGSRYQPRSARAEFAGAEFGGAGFAGAGFGAAERAGSKRGVSKRHTLSTGTGLGAWVCISHSPCSGWGTAWLLDQDRIKQRCAGLGTGLCAIREGT